LSNLPFKANKGISCETGDAFFNDRSHQSTIIPAEILFPVISDLIDPATDQKGNAMAKSHYQFKKRQKNTRPLQWSTGKHRDRPATIAGAIQWQ
jgi:hypothetical protein